MSNTLCSAGRNIGWTVNGWGLSAKNYGYDGNPSASIELNEREGIDIIFVTGEKRVALAIVNLLSFDTNEDIPEVVVASENPQGYYLAAKTLTDTLGLPVIPLASIIDLLVHKKQPLVFQREVR